MSAKRSSADKRVHSPRRGASAASWILLMPNIPPSPAYVRVKVWRRLQDVGAVALKNSVYVLPNRDDCVEAFEWVAKEIRELGGQVSLCDGQFFDGETDADIRRRFCEARNADYASVVERARKLLKTARAKRGPATGLSSQVEKLRARFDAIAAQDYADASGHKAAEAQVVELERALAARAEPESARDPRAIVRRPRGATWVTRHGVHVDRIASAWLIRRFVDPRARLKFVPAKGYEPLKGELRFDMFDAEFTHEGDRCTFEVLLARFGIDDPALGAIAEIIHDLDLRDDKFGRVETAGVRSVIDGICSSEGDDDGRIAQGSAVFAGLHATFSRAARKRSPRTEAP